MSEDITTLDYAFILACKRSLSTGQCILWMKRELSEWCGLDVSLDDVGQMFSGTIGKLNLLAGSRNMFKFYDIMRREAFWTSTIDIENIEKFLTDNGVKVTPQNKFCIMYLLNLKELVTNIYVDTVPGLAEYVEQNKSKWGV